MNKRVITPTFVNDKPNGKEFEIMPLESGFWGLNIDNVPFTGKIEIKQATVYGMMPLIAYFVDGHLYRNNGPSMVMMKNSLPYVEHWVANGIQHREDGPAWIHHIKNLEEYYLNGRKINKKKFIDTIGMPLNIRFPVCILGGNNE